MAAATATGAAATALAPGSGAAVGADIVCCSPAARCHAVANVGAVLLGALGLEVLLEGCVACELMALASDSRGTVLAPAAKGVLRRVFLGGSADGECFAAGDFTTSLSAAAAEAAADSTACVVVWLPPLQLPPDASSIAVPATVFGRLRS